MKYKIVTLFLLLAALVMRVERGYAQEVDYKAYSLFVYNFMKYIEWPPAQSRDDFVIGIFGDSPIQKELEVMAAAKKCKGRTIVIKKITSVDESTNCQLLYVASSKSSQLKTLLPVLKNKSMLLVAERDGMAKKGAHISFTTLDDDVLKFEINKKNIESQNLKVSSALTSLGILVN